MAAPGEALRSRCEDWRGLVDAFLNGKLNFGFCLELIQATFAQFKDTQKAVSTCVS